MKWNHKLTGISFYPWLSGKRTSISHLIKSNSYHGRFYGWYISIPGFNPQLYHVQTCVESWFPCPTRSIRAGEEVFRRAINVVKHRSWVIPGGLPNTWHQGGGGPPRVPAAGVHSVKGTCHHCHHSWVLWTRGSTTSRIHSGKSHTHGSNPRVGDGPQVAQCPEFTSGMQESHLKSVA